MSDFERVSRVQRIAVGTRFLRLRPWVTAPGVVTAMLLTKRAGIPDGQWLALVLSTGPMLALFIAESVYFRRRQVREWQLFASLCVTTVGISFICLLSGGLASPFLPLEFAPLITTFAAFATSRLPVFHSLLAVVCGIILVALPGPFLPIPAPLTGPMTLMAFGISGGLLYLSVGGLARAFHTGGQDLERMRSASLRDFEIRYESLEFVGAQVAHELKNPLAAMKGLVQLTARTVEDARNLARLEVVEGEIRRMEETLLGYLAYGRPARPLERAEVRVDQLIEGLRALFEARAEVEGVVLQVDARADRYELDSLRIREALMNMVCNAFDALDGQGGTIELGSSACAGVQRLFVRDSGRGAEAPAKVFGFGLGMRVSRGIIEQHGGQLVLKSGSTGTLAEITLPAQGV